MPRNRKPDQEQERLRAQGLCGAKLRSKKRRCKKGAGWGTQHAGIGACKLHGGNMETHNKAALKRQAAEAVEQYGLPRDIDPNEALLEELARTAGHIDWLRIQIGTLDESQLIAPTGQEGPSETGGEHHPHWERSIWIGMYQDERKHLTQVAATCIKVGIEERRVQIAEAQGQLIAQVIKGVLADLNVSPERAGPLVRKHLAALDGNAINSTAREIPEKVPA